MDFLWNLTLGVPFIVLFMYLGSVFCGTFVMGWIWAQNFDIIMWNEDQMTEILGEDIMRNHRRAPR